MDNTRNKCVNLGMEALKGCSLLVSKYSEGEEKQVQFNKLVEIMGYYCELDSQYENSLKATNEAKKLLKSKRKDEEQSDGNDDRPIREVYKEILATKESTSSSVKLKTFKEHIARLQKASEAAEDVEMSQITLNPVDPLTKKMMVNPVKSSKCGHTFEKDSILSLLALKKKQLRCPIPGCPHHITKDLLEPDLEIKQLLQRMGNRQ